MSILTLIVSRPWRCIIVDKICGDFQASANDDDDDDDVDLFGEETEEEKKAAEERAAAVKASGKKKECKFSCYVSVFYLWFPFYTLIEAFS